MLSTKVAVYTTPSVAAIVVQFSNDSSSPPTVTVENLDGGQSCAIKYQESDDGTTWNDIAGTNATVNPGTLDVQEVVSTRRLIALHAGSAVQVMFNLQRSLAGAPLSLGSTC